jgi:hypothetical protein
VTALGAIALASLAREAREFGGLSGPSDQQWKFHLPLEPPFKRFDLTMSGPRMHISMLPGFGLKFRLVAAEEGVVASARRPLVNGIAVDHGAEWQTLYQVRKGLGRGLVPKGQYVRRGDPLIEIDGSGIGIAEAAHEILSISVGGEIKNATFQVIIHSETDEAC